ncbi:hypothetical protein [Leptolyngbya sp. GGD]|uniref:hypothetical protein n=1 Tax=Leptolyngbya sp. GGD TaxID=2997907 RepID=UPI00227B332C|nr:hypothetical protein [Leptolyngbya sp. GGD]MCY6494527.1 hypothetical protein [Leptolyngbya sp. GGD]
MNSSLLERLATASTDEERTWILTESAISSLAPELQQVTWALAIPHWVNLHTLEVLCPELLDEALELYLKFIELSFVEKFREEAFSSINWRTIGIKRLSFQT